jgi:hypothetical protein
MTMPVTAKGADAYPITASPRTQGLSVGKR